MFRINEHYQELGENYLFSEIARRVAAYRAAHPGEEPIRLGIGDVTLPLVPAAVEAMQRAAAELGNRESFRGYGPEQGYDFLREAICAADYAPLGVEIDPGEIFVSDGAKCDVGNIQELFAPEAVVAICDPVYPVYRDSNIMAGRGGNIRLLSCLPESGFLPEIPAAGCDLVYLCSPNNPTGAAFTRDELSKWVDYAHRWGALLLFDSAYEAFVTDPEVPRSIYELRGAREVAIEFRSFSKTAGFTGVRCAYCVVPRALPQNLNHLWLRRQTTKFNGVSYVVQRAAEAVCLPEGRAQLAGQIAFYRENAALIRDGLERAGYRVCGGVNSPYVWWELPGRCDSFAFFDRLLERCRVVGTPGAGFGSCGEGFFRLTGFGDRESTIEAVRRVATEL